LTIRETFRKTPQTEIFRGVLAVVFTIVLLAGLTGCDPGADITWVNETDQEADIYLGDGLNDFDTSVPPHSSREVGTIQAAWQDVVVIRDKQGNVLLRQEITWEELKQQGFRFMIRPESAVPTPTSEP
jgi:hypothetical protein